MDSKLKLPPLPQQQNPQPELKVNSAPPVPSNPSQTEQEPQQKPSGAGRFLTEVNGVPVWVDSSQSTGQSDPSKAQNSGSQPKSKEQISSNIQRMLGI